MQSFYVLQKLVAGEYIVNTILSFLLPSARKRYEQLIESLKENFCTAQKRLYEKPQNLNEERVKNEVQEARDKMEKLYNQAGQILEKLPQMCGFFDFLTDNKNRRETITENCKIIRKILQNLDQNLCQNYTKYVTSNLGSSICRMNAFFTITFLARFVQFLVAGIIFFVSSGLSALIFFLDFQIILQISKTFSLTYILDSILKQTKELRQQVEVMFEKFKKQENRKENGWRKPL